ncbi:hypothetical protein DUI87_28014 [Hirundo rustica rustica]|uniref:Uncharacterized protein n=1 Tax=Hirundo rustica rustica TaxID=333673 RepID=A0A3M0J6C9_HIRRU|nr:hypothetical protein DUI87_28014 [Hirundo rustica rustica]
MQKSRFCIKHEPFSGQNPGSQECISKRIPDLLQVNRGFCTAEFLLLLKGNIYTCAGDGLCDVEYTEIENFRYFVDVQAAWLKEHSYPNYIIVLNLEVIKKRDIELSQEMTPEPEQQNPGVCKYCQGIIVALCLLFIGGFGQSRIIPSPQNVEESADFLELSIQDTQLLCWGRVGDALHFQAGNDQEKVADKSEFTGQTQIRSTFIVVTSQASAASQEYRHPGFPAAALLLF